MDRYQKTKVWVPGPFCSELVAGALSDVLPRRRLFNKPRKANRVNPNSFLRSRLRPVTGAVCEADAEAALDTTQADEYNRAIGYSSREMPPVEGGCRHRQHRQR